MCSSTFSTIDWKRVGGKSSDFRLSIGRMWIVSLSPRSLLLTLVFYCSCCCTHFKQQDQISRNNDEDCRQARRIFVVPTILTIQRKRNSTIEDDRFCRLSDSLPQTNLHLIGDDIFKDSSEWKDDRYSMGWSNTFPWSMCNAILTKWRQYSLEYTVISSDENVSVRWNQSGRESRRADHKVCSSDLSIHLMSDARQSYERTNVEVKEGLSRSIRWR